LVRGTLCSLLEEAYNGLLAPDLAAGRTSSPNEAPENGMVFIFNRPPFSQPGCRVAYAGFEECFTCLG
jgi:hypothetical protein